MIGRLAVTSSGRNVKISRLAVTLLTGAVKDYSAKRDVNDAGSAKT